MQLSVTTEHLWFILAMEKMTCMTGKELFDHYQAAALRNGFGSAEFSYGNVLFEAMKLEGEATVFRKLEEAYAKGRKIQLAYSTSAKGEHTEPDLVVIA